MRQLATIILAAGKGTRMKSAIPKVLHEVCGRPLLDYVLDVSQRVGSLKTYVVLGFGIEKIQPRLPKKVVTVEQKKLLGTGDAVKTAVVRAKKFFKNFSGDVLILCGDTPLLTAQTIKLLINRHRQTKAAATILTAIVEDSSGYGRMIRDHSDRVMTIREEIDADQTEKQVKEINVGVYCFKAKTLFENLKKIKVSSQKGEYYLTNVVAVLAEQGLKVETQTTPDPAEGRGVNTREDLADCAAVLRQRILKALMLDGVTIIDPATTHIASDAKIGADTTIRPFTVIDSDVVIGKNCLIGPFAHFRQGTRIANNVEIGNFTEVSRTKIGDRGFMKHFSFLGDAQLGKDVNIGAGTITANFDGKNKNKTIIGDGAFIGSDSILVAPVKVGKKSMTGAGSVVTAGKVIPDGKIFVGVPARMVPGKQAFK